MNKKEMIKKISVVIQDTHNKKDIQDLQSMGRIELKEILFDLYFGSDFINSSDKGSIKEYDIENIISIIKINK